MFVGIYGFVTCQTLTTFSCWNDFLTGRIAGKSFCYLVREGCEVFMYKNSRAICIFVDIWGILRTLSLKI